VDSAEKPPVFGTPSFASKKRLKNFAARFDMRVDIQPGATFWRCFQVALFAQMGFSAESNVAI